MTHRVADPVTGYVTIVPRLREEWKRRDVPVLRVVPQDLWDRTQVRLKEGKHGALWTAAFTLNAIPVLARPTRQWTCPTAGT